MPRAKVFKFQVWQYGVMVAYVESGNWKSAKKEADHYALIYGQDGPVEIKEVGDA